MLLIVGTWCWWWFGWAGAIYIFFTYFVCQSSYENRNYRGGEDWQWLSEFKGLLRPVLLPSPLIFVMFSSWEFLCSRLLSVPEKIKHAYFSMRKEKCGGISPMTTLPLSIQHLVDHLVCLRIWYLDVVWEKTEKAYLVSCLCRCQLLRVFLYTSNVLGYFYWQLTFTYMKKKLLRVIFLASFCKSHTHLRGRSYSIHCWYVSNKVEYRVGHGLKTTKCILTNETTKEDIDDV